MLNWKNANSILLMVLLPAMNAPKPPMVGAINGHSDPNKVDTPSANTMGI
tara:strand:+ start:2190 stop:2339 length:150 start_codon:yes stop_codon:yes gene_type:complete